MQKPRPICLAKRTQGVLTLLLVVLGFSVQSQSISSYTTSASSGTYTSLSGATAPGLSSGTVDDGYFNNIPIGFDFWYMGVRRTHVTASTNGFFSFGSSQTATYTNNLSTGGSPRPIIAPLWDDLDIQNASNFSYLTTGTAPNRVLTLQWSLAQWSYNATGNTISFQAKLYETSGRIEFIYKPETGTVYTPSASVGITATATGSGNFLSLSNIGTSPSVSLTTETTTINTKPASGQTISFSSTAPNAPTLLNFTNVSTTAATLNWTDNSTNEAGFVIYQSANGVNYTFHSQVAANTTTANVSGLTANTTYYYRVHAVSVGAISSAYASGNLSTSCTTPPAPVVTSPINYCQNAVASPLTATGTNLLWQGVPVAGSVGGTDVWTSPIYVDAIGTNNRKTKFVTTTANVTIKSVDYYIPANRQANAVVLALFNSAGTVIAISSTTTNLSTGGTAALVTNNFNYTIAAAGEYSVGVYSGYGHMGFDNPTFPITEPTGTVNITGVTTAGYRCFNNIQFTANGTSSVAPTPSTTISGSTSYTVTQTVNGCVSAPATIIVNVTPLNLSQRPATNLIAHYSMNGSARDELSNNEGTLQNAAPASTDRYNNANSALSFNGTNQYITTANAYTNPAEFSISLWFKTNTTTGGKLVGFGNSQTAQSGSYDRHIYMTNSGQLYFGVYPGAVATVNTTLSYNDDAWHHVTATLSSTAGMTLYVDGQVVASNASVRTAENYTGYWKIGYDNTVGWPSSPTSAYFKGTMDEVLIYHRALTPAEVATLYSAPEGASNNGPVCAGSTLTLNAKTITGATYLWTGPNGFNSTSQNPTLTYSAAAAGVYTLKVTVNGCTGNAYTLVQSSPNAGQWTGAVSTDWANANNWCNGVVPSANTDVSIPASALRMPSILSSVFANNLLVEAGATLTTTATGTLSVAGTITNEGNMVNNGTTSFSGSNGVQTFTGVSSFHNVTINNTSGISLLGNIVINNHLTLQTGKIITNNFDIAIKGNWNNNSSLNALETSSSTVTFNGTTEQLIGGSFATNFNNLIISNTTKTTLQTVIYVTGNLTVSSGVFDLSSFTANRTTAGGTLTVANNATLRIGGTNGYPTNYSNNLLIVASTVEYAGTNQPIAPQAYGNLSLTGTGSIVKTFPSQSFTILGNLSAQIIAPGNLSFTAASNITVNGNFTLGTSVTFHGAGYTHNIGGNWQNNGTFNGQTSTIIFSGSGTTVNGTGVQSFNNITVSAPLINFNANLLSLTGNLATTGSGGFKQASNATLEMSGSAATITGGNISLNTLKIIGNVSTSEALTLTGDLIVSGGFTSGIGTITMSGASKFISGTGTMALSAVTISGSVTTTSNISISKALAVNGSLSASAGTITFKETATLSGVANLFNVTLDGTYLKLSANSNLGVAGQLQIITGNLDVSSVPNTVSFNGTVAQNINALTYCHLVLSNGDTKTATGNISTIYDLTIETGTTFAASSFTHSIYGNWINNGTLNAGTSTVQFLGPATAYIRGATTFNILTSNTSSSNTELILQSNVSAAIVNMTRGIIRTGTNVLTITNTRSGDGIIWGNIQRDHSYTTGVAYAFESPYNTIAFASVSGVNSIRVSVKEGAVSDFPFGGSISREYTVAIPYGTYNATLRLHYDDKELNGNDESSMELWSKNGAAWHSSGKTGNDATVNYVEQSGLTNLNLRWTCSDNSNVVQWNGSISSDWNTPGNWTVLQGSASRPPAATDIVNIGTAAFNHQPVISSTVAVKNIVFGDLQPVILSLTTGGSLTSGDINGVWNINQTHTINVNDQTLILNGDLTLSDGITNHSINLTINNGLVDAQGSLIQAGNASVTFTGNGVLKIFHDYHYTSGSFTAGTGTVEYFGLDNQQVANVIYHNLRINKQDGVASFKAATTVQGDLTISAGVLDNYTILTVLRNVTINSGGRFTNNNHLLVGGDWTNNGEYIATEATITFNGTGTQRISASTFNNLIIDKPVGTIAEITGNVLMKGNFHLTSGTLDIKTYVFDRLVQGGSIVIENAGTIIVAGNNAPANFTGGGLAPQSTVIANGTVPQMIFGDVYGNLIFRNGGLKTLITPITVNGDLTIESGATFDAANHTLTLNGNFINQGNFIPSGSTTIFSGAAKNVSGNTTFNIATFTGSYTFLHNVTINKLLHITATGSLSGGPSIHTIMHGDLINSGVLYTLGKTTFTGNVVQTLSLINATQTLALTVDFNGSVSPVLNSTSVPQFGYLNINNTSGVAPSVGWNIMYSLNIGNGASFTGGEASHNFYGSLTNNGVITSNGTINFLPTSSVPVNFGTKFTSTGLVVIGGSGAMSISGTPGPFNDLLISNINAAGIAPSSDWIIQREFKVNSGSIFKAGTYTYHVGGNINNIGTIVSNTSTFVLNGNGDQEIYSLSDFNNLTIDKPASRISLKSNITIKGTLNFISGVIKTDSFHVNLPAGAAVAGAAGTTGWVDGNLQKHIASGSITSTFEIGDNDSYTPVSLGFTSVTQSGELLARSHKGDHSNLQSSLFRADRSVNRYWSFTNKGVVYTEASITVNWVSTDVDLGSTPANFKLGVYENTQWTYPSVSGPLPTSIQATQLTSLSAIAVGEYCTLNTAFSYPGSPFCARTGSAVPVITGTAGTFSAGEGLAIDPVTGVINIALSVTGTYTVVNYATSDGGCTSTSFTTVVIGLPPVVNVTRTETCVGGSTGSITITPLNAGTYTYSLNGGTFQSTPGFVNLAAGNYSVQVKGSDGCITSSNVTIVSYAVSSDDQDAMGSDSWIGHMYDNINFQSYLGHFTEPEVFNEMFGSSASCFNIISNDSARSIYTETFSVKFRMKSSRKGLYRVDLGSDDGSRLTVDGTLVYNNWVDQGYTSRPNTLINLNGNSVLLYEFYERGGQNQVRFQNLTLIIENKLAQNTDQKICSGTTGLEISGDSFGTLPTGISVSGSGYQWTFSTTPEGPRTVITGATAASYTPSATQAPFNQPGIYYLYRNAVLASTNNVAVNPYITTNESNAVIIEITPAPSATIAYNGNPYCTNGGIASVILTGNTGGAFSSVPGIILNSISGNITLSSSKEGTYSVTYTIEPKDGCLQYQTNATVVIGKAGSWTGEINNSWNETGNWQCKVLPSTSTDVNIPANITNYPILHLFEGFAHDLTIETGGSLLISEASLNISGTIMNSGVFDATNGKIKLNGSAAQTIPADAFVSNTINDLTVQNSSGVIISGPLNITGILLAATGQLQTSGHLTLISTATKTALIDGSGNGNITGSVNIQRYMPSSFGYKYLSSPFQSATVNEFSDEMDLNASFPSFYKYDEARASSGWVNYTSPTGLLNPMEGYAIHFGQIATHKTISISGTVNNGIISSPILYNHNQPYTLGFHLVGNPYPSPIDWNASNGWSRSNIDNAVYYFNASTSDPYSGTYSSYVNGISSDGVANNIIPAMQGFFVHVTDGNYPVSGQLTVNNAARTTHLAPVFHTYNGQLLRLNAGFSDQVRSDAAVIYFNNEAQETFNKKNDALKLMNTNADVPNLYTVSVDSAKLSIKALTYPRDSVTVQPLGLKVEKDGLINFDAPDVSRLSPSLRIYLYDAKTSRYHDLKANPRYSVHLNKGVHDSRFFVVFSFSDLSTSSNNPLQPVKVYGSGTVIHISSHLADNEKAGISIFDTKGRKVYEKELNGAGHQRIEQRFTNGIYLVRVQSDKGVYTNKIFIGK